MHIENNSAYTPPLYTRATGKAANEDAEQASTPPPSGSQETAAADTAKAAAVTGVTGSNLSKEVIDQLMKATQEADTSNTDTEKYDGPLSIGERHHLEDIASNTEYAKKQAEVIGAFPEIYFIKSLPANGSSKAEQDAIFAEQNALRAHMNQVQGERTAYYEGLKTQGLPPAEIYAKVLEFNANLPESHDAASGWSKSGRAMSYSDYNKTRLDYLRNLIDQNNAATASVKTADSTKAAQESGTSNTDTEKYDGPLLISERHGLEAIASDTEYAKKISKIIGTGPDLIHINESQMPKNGGDPSYAKAFYKRIDALQSKASEVHEKRTKFYETQVAQNVPPAQIYANLMEFNASLSQGYWDAVSIGYEKPSRTIVSFQASHDYLQNLIDQSNAATASVKTADSTKVAG